MPRKSAYDETPADVLAGRSCDECRQPFDVKRVKAGYGDLAFEGGEFVRVWVCQDCLSAMLQGKRGRK